ncbi:hypothetical protein CVIRNUC_007360 [Coccomyxa viridis]|uniref:AP2/ERF domain-containing protein n=1 Tax=Coccomyxa viridis TaxID=1274662 RepID=A0AAV1IAN7_9CHLO|nr:hypothetical protein CVIRNUC_007360 [Coccomyxa viridis]
MLESQDAQAGHRANELSQEDWDFLLRLQEGPGQNNWAYNLAERLLPGMQGGMPAAEAVPAACAQRSFGHASSAAPGCGQPQSMPLQAAEQARVAYACDGQAASPQKASLATASACTTPPDIMLPGMPTACRAPVRNPVLRSCPLSGAVAPPTSGHLLDWPPSLNLPTSPHVPEVGPPSNKGESLSPWSTSAPGKLMAQWLASDLPISPHLGWLQPSSDRHNFMLLGQQGDELADQVLRYRSQARPTRKPRSAGRRPAVPSPHQPCLDSPGDQGSRKASSDGPGSQNRKSAPGTPKAEGSAQGTPQQTPKRALPQRPPQLPAGRATRSILPSKRTLEASEDAEQQNDSPGLSSDSPPPKRAARASSKAGSSAAQKRLQGASASSVYRGVSRHRLTQRWEASLWLAGKQMYLGGFQDEDDAARAYDLAALACKGPTVPTNFPAEGYSDSLAEIGGSSREEIVAWVRRRSSAFSRGRSRFRGVSGQAGHWEARIGTFGDRKNVSFGIHETEEEAARQYDRALIVEKGRAAKTNFPIVLYEEEVAFFESSIAKRFGGLNCPAAEAFMAEMTLPYDESGTGGPKPVQQLQQKNRGGRPRNNAASVIYGSALQLALSSSRPATAGEAGDIKPEQGLVPG